MNFQYDSDKKIYVPGVGPVLPKDFADDWATMAELPGTLDFQSKLPSTEQMNSDSAWVQSLIGDGGNQGGRATTRAVRNLHQSMNIAFYRKSVNKWGKGAGGFTGGIMTSASGLIEQIATPIVVGMRGNPDQMFEELGQLVLTKAIQLLSKIPVVGQILAALVAVGAMLVKMFTYNAKLEDQEFSEAYASRKARLLNLGGAGSQIDQAAVNEVILGQNGEFIQSTDWTQWFLPRYDWKSDWIGIRRDTGMEFAPGRSTKWGEGQFEPSSYGEDSRPCVGFIPGTQQVTAEIQVINPLAAQDDFPMIGGRKKSKQHKGDMWEMLLWDGPYQLHAFEHLPMGGYQKADVRDYGDFFPSSAQLLTSLWGHIQADGNPDLYRIDTHVLDEAWRSYCGGARDYVRHMCSWDQWGSQNAHHSNIAKGENMQDMERAWVANFSCGIPCVLGSWRCKTTSYADVSKRYFRMGDEYENCAANFNSWGSESAADCRAGDMYTDYIKDVVKEFRRRQFSMLKHSLVCAYVRSSFIAFQKDEAMMQRLYEMRQMLLTRKDQWRYLVEQDVPHDEVHNGQNWYNLLKSKGAFSIAYRAGSKTSVSAQWGTYDRGEAKLIKPRDFGTRVGLVPGSLAPPVDIGGRVPGEEYVPEGEGRGGKTGSSSSLPLLLGAAALAFLFMKSRR